MSSFKDGGTSFIDQHRATPGRVAGPFVNSVCDVLRVRFRAGGLIQKTSDRFSETPSTPRNPAAWGMGYRSCLLPVDSSMPHGGRLWADVCMHLRSRHFSSRCPAAGKGTHEFSSCGSPDWRAEWRHRMIRFLVNRLAEITKRTTFIAQGANKPAQRSSGWRPVTRIVGMAVPPPP